MPVFFEWCEWPTDYLNDGLPAADRCVDAHDPQPFEDFLLPMVAVGRRQLSEKINLEKVSEEAHIGLERHLLRRLSQIAAPTLVHEFWQVRLESDPMLAFMEPNEIQDPPERSAYIAFVERLLAPQHWRSFFKQYSALGRLLAETVEQWVTVSAEFFTRLEEDWPQIAPLFFDEGDNLASSPSIPQIAAIKAGLSDPHNFGRTVIQVTFDGGKQLIYKPRELALERAYQDFMAWINDAGHLLPLKEIEVLDRGTHGWVECIPHQPCHMKEEVRRAFTRCGMLSATMYILHGIDFHYENIISSGEHPQPVDMEMLLYPPVNHDTAGPVDLAQFNFQSQTIAHSVLASGILPIASGEGGNKDDFSFLGAMAQSRPAFSGRQLVFVNSDLMRWQTTKKQLSMAAQPYILLLGDEIQRPQDFLDEIEAGFVSMLRFFVDQKAVLLDEDGPLGVFRGLSGRFVFRPTAVYFKIFRASLQPQVMGEGIDRHICLEQLGRIFSQGDGAVSRFWPLLKEEIEALFRGDVPIFHMKSDSRDLYTQHGAVVLDCFAQTGFEQMMAALAGLDDKVVEKQVRIARLALYSLAIEPPAGGSQVATGRLDVLPPSQPEPTVQVLSAADLLTEAERIGRQIKRMALIKGSQAHWFSIDYVLKRKKYHPIMVGSDLYHGQVGIALFLAALWKETGDASTLDLAYAAVHDLHQGLDQGHTGVLRRMGTGGLLGLGSLVYGLTRCGLVLDDEALLKAAGMAADLITPEMISEDNVLDVMGGSAGAILGLLTLYEVSGSDRLLDSALACGNHLLANQVEGQDWATYENQQLTGFAHGAGGISHALLRLGLVSGREAFMVSARQGFAFESLCYDPAIGQWPDRRYEDRVKGSWCHGAPGIALSRLSWAGSQDLERGLQATYQAVMQADLRETADLCCGHWGRVEILFDGGLRSGNEEYTRAALALASHLIADAGKNGGYHLFQGMPRDVILPGFFIGLAGIGYSCLRLAREGDLPSVLLMA